VVRLRPCPRSRPWFRFPRREGQRGMPGAGAGKMGGVVGVLCHAMLCYDAMCAAARRPL
jgi:hypothetical protein